MVGEDLDNSGTEGQRVQLRTRTLEEILDTHCAPAVMDYLSLDVEGAEWRVHSAPCTILEALAPLAPLGTSGALSTPRTPNTLSTP